MINKIDEEFLRMLRDYANEGRYAEGIRYIRDSGYGWFLPYDLPATEDEEEED